MFNAASINWNTLPATQKVTLTVAWAAAAVMLIGHAVIIIEDVREERQLNKARQNRVPTA